MTRWIFMVAAAAFTLTGFAGLRPVGIAALAGIGCWLLLRIRRFLRRRAALRTIEGLRSLPPR